MKKLKIFFILSVILISCNGTKNVIGKYRSNFATLGFFITEIKLKPDNTFHYEFTGDLQHSELNGNYKIKNNKLYLKFNKLKGETEQEVVQIIGNDTLVNIANLGNYHPYELKKEKEIEYHLKYKISKNKLRVYNINTNKLVTKAKVYSEKRKYIIFGPRHYKKKSFLKKNI